MQEIGENAWDDKQASGYNHRLHSTAGNGASQTASHAHRGARNDTLLVIQVNVTPQIYDCY